MKLLQQWPWNALFLKLYIIVPIAISLLFTGLFYPLYHAYTFIILLLIPCGLFFYFLLSPVKKQVDTLLTCISAQNGEAVESLLLINKKQSPGIVILRDNVIILIPVDGRRRKLPLTDIKSVITSTRLANKQLISKTVFTLITQKDSQYVFAVSRSIGTRWSARLLDDTRNTI